MCITAKATFPNWKLLCLSSIFKQLLLRNCAVDFVQICNVCTRKVIIKVAERMFNSDKIWRSYCDFYFGVTFFGTQCIYFTNLKSMFNDSVYVWQCVPLSGYTCLSVCLCVTNLYPHLNRRIMIECWCWRYHWQWCWSHFKLCVLPAVQPQAITTSPSSYVNCHHQNLTCSFQVYCQGQMPITKYSHF